MNHFQFCFFQEKELCKLLGLLSHYIKISEWHSLPRCQEKARSLFYFIKHKMGLAFNDSICSTRQENTIELDFLKRVKKKPTCLSKSNILHLILIKKDVLSLPYLLGILDPSYSFSISRAFRVFWYCNTYFCRFSDVFYSKSSI